MLNVLIIGMQARDHPYRSDNMEKPSTCQA
jgi:hypothetical protein